MVKLLDEKYDRAYLKTKNAVYEICWITRTHDNKLLVRHFPSKVSEKSKAITPQELQTDTVDEKDVVELRYRL
ncbi:MAG: hypothetical protein WC554_10675 [Clostridia bacterium]|jgi:hypothetical protein